jgi:enoyl-CoA hydratase/carnithine racemase
MSWQTIKFELEDHIAVITFNRPEAMNAISTQLAKDIIAVTEELAGDRQVWVAILTAAGERSFCVGADLKERKDMSKEDMVKQRELFVKAFRAVTEFPKPLIAAVNGYAMGGGFEFALGCDVIYASEKAILALPEVGLGIIPGGGGTINLPRLIGKSKAKELIFTGRRLNAEEAYNWGIVSKVVPPEQLVEAAKELAREMTKNAPIAVWQAKKSVNLGTEVDLATAFALEAECYNFCLKTEDRDEGLRAFNEKRKPVYKGL